MRKGESRAGGGNGAVEGSLGEERDESVKSKDRVQMYEWNSSRKCQCVIFQLLYSNGDINS